MKIIILMLVLFITVPQAHADGTAEAEASAAVFGRLAQKYTDNFQFIIGGTGIISEKKVTPELHMGLDYRFLGKYKFGVSSDLSLQNNANNPDFNFGLTAGVKNFNSTLGQHFFNVSVGGSIFDEGEGIYVEPQVEFILNESKPIKFFWVMHSIGVTSTLGLRHIFIQNDTDALSDTNTLILRFSLFVKQRKRR